MLAATVFGVFVIPLLYVLIQRVAEWLQGETQEPVSAKAKT